MKTIAVLIHAFNEENQIEACIHSARLLTDNILVVDQNSTDDTANIVHKQRVKVVSFPQVAYVEKLRERAINQVAADWILILDPDERMTRELVEEIKKTIPLTAFTSYKVPRKNIFGGTKWLQHGGWWPDLQIRLIKKEAFRTWPKDIHSTPVIEGKQGVLSHPLTHLFHGDIGSMVQKTIRFEQIEADLLHKAGRRPTIHTFMRKFAGELFRRLIRDKGFLDGTIGIIESIYQAFSKTITYLYLYEKSRSL